MAKKEKTQKNKNPLVVFLIYTAAAFALVMCFRFIFPASAAPLGVFARDWRVIQALLTFFDLFPAVAFSALVIPFSLNFYEGSGTRFSQEHFKRIMASVYTAICAAMVYAGIFFFAMPAVRNIEEDMVSRSGLFHLATERASALGRAGYMSEALQFLQIGESIWPENRALEEIRRDIYFFHARRQAPPPAADGFQGPVLPWGPAAGLTLSQAIALSENALEEGRYFDSHWLATIAARLAIPGSPDAANATRLASLAWNQISALAAGELDALRFALFHRKLEGYTAMNSGEWIRAFFIFQELADLTPEDPDVVNFLAYSEFRANEVAFFIDEMPSWAFGQMLTGAVFSLPGPAGSRSVMRFSWLSMFANSAYGFDFEYMRFDINSNLLVSMSSPYARLLPTTAQGTSQVMLQPRAVDRHDQYRPLEPTVHAGEYIVGPAIILDLSFEELLFLAQVRRGIPSIRVDELFTAQASLAAKGYAVEVFQAEILNRFAAMFFLPFSIFALLAGWRLRPQGKALHYFFVLSFPVLPVIFHAIVLIYRSALNNLGIFLTISLGFTAALTVFTVIFALSFFASLLLLAAQSE